MLLKMLDSLTYDKLNQFAIENDIKIAKYSIKDRNLTF